MNEYKITVYDHLDLLLPEISSEQVKRDYYDELVDYMKNITLTLGVSEFKDISIDDKYPFPIHIENYF